MNLRIVFKFKDCKLQFYGKRKLFSYFSVNPRTPASRQRRLLKLKRKKIILLRLSLASFSLHHYSQQQRSSFLLFITRQKLSNALKSLKLKKKFTGIDQASEQVPFSTSNLKLALAHARNSRVKKMTNLNSYLTSRCFFLFTFVQLSRFVYLFSEYTTYISKALVQIKLSWKRQICQYSLSIKDDK